MSALFVHRLRVRYGECDPQGIVFNANYLLYFDVAYTELWRAAVGPWHELTDAGFDSVVAETNLRFHAPARFDDLLDIEATFARIGSSSITTELRVTRDGELLVEGWLRHVCVDSSGWRKTELPGWLRERLERYVDSAASSSA